MTDTDIVKPTAERPLYSKQRQDDEGRGRKSNLFFVICDEGWRQSIVCTGMYEWAADWFIEKVQGQPYAAEKRG